MYLSISNIVSNENKRYCISRYIFNASTIHNCTQLKLGIFWTQIRSVPNEITSWRSCTSDVSCVSGDTVSSATGGEFVVGSLSFVIVMHEMISNVFL